MSTTEIQLTLTLSKVECCECHGIFAVSKRWEDDRRNDHKSWPCIYCGTMQSWGGETKLQKAERLRLGVEAQLQRERSRHDQTKAALRETEMQRRAEKGAKTKLKRRVSAGVCPCCSRSFADLRRHMEGVHPEFVSEAKKESQQEALDKTSEN